MSTSTAGRIKRRFIWAIRLCPPARTLASSPYLASSASASSSLDARTYRNGAGFIVQCSFRATTGYTVNRGRRPPSGREIGTVPETSLGMSPRQAPLGPRPNENTWASGSGLMTRSSEGGINVGRGAGQARAAAAIVQERETRSSSLIDASDTCGGSNMPKPTKEDVLKKAEELKNWGKWGPDDELGVLNYVTPEDIVSAAKLVRKGRVFRL